MDHGLRRRRANDRLLRVQGVDLRRPARGPERNRLRRGSFFLDGSCRSDPCPFARVRGGAARTPLARGVGHRRRCYAVFRLSRTAAVCHPTARVVKDRAPFAAKHSFAFLKGTVAEGAKALLETQWAKPAVDSVSSRLSSSSIRNAERDRKVPSR